MRQKDRHQSGQKCTDMTDTSPVKSALTCAPRASPLNPCAGLEYDDSSSTCVPCADGWKRLASIDDVCVACTAGTYKLNATHCTACTGNTVAPVDAMSECGSP